MRQLCREAIQLVDGLDIDDYLDDLRNQRALERVLELIGEVATRLEPVAPGLPIPWKELKGIRVVLAHAYHRVDQPLLFHTARTHVPRLLNALEDL